MKDEFPFFSHMNSYDTVPLLLLTMVMLLQETALVRIFSLKTKKGRGKRTASLPVLPSLSNFSRLVRYKNPTRLLRKKRLLGKFFWGGQLVKKNNLQSLPASRKANYCKNLAKEHRIRYVNKFIFFSVKISAYYEHLAINIYSLHNVYHQY
jgi:hypothetical protein